MSIFDEAARLERENVPFALAHIIESHGSTPRHSGQMIVQSDGKIIGTIGGGMIERMVIAEAVEAIGERYYLMFDFMINHISAHSDYYLDLIYKRKDKAPWEDLEFADGSHEKMWNTFGPDQIDLDVRTEVTKRFVKETL